MNSSLVHILNNVKNKNTELFIEKINKLNTTNPTEEDYQCLTRKKSLSCRVIGSKSYLNSFSKKKI